MVDLHELCQDLAAALPIRTACAIVQRRKRTILTSHGLECLSASEQETVVRTALSVSEAARLPQLVDSLDKRPGRKIRASETLFASSRMQVLVKSVTETDLMFLLLVSARTDVGYAWRALRHAVHRYKAGHQFEQSSPLPAFPAEVLCRDATQRCLHRLGYQEEDLQGQALTAH